MRRFSLLLAGLALLVLPTLARAENVFGSMPAADGKKSALQIRQVDFSGGASGHIMVEVRNPTQGPEAFEARGLYFVPRGNAQSAPQRVGAVGPFDAKEGQTWRRMNKLVVEPGQTVRLKLQTFCLDSHRGSPGKGQGYKVARERLPKDLTSANEAAATRSLKAKSGKFEDAQGEIQSQVWSNRNKKWIKLEGERAHEKDAPPSGALRNSSPRLQQNRVED
jgi:hypothetical protein